MAKITFDSIAGGELAERFKIALAQVGRNFWIPIWIRKQKEESRST